jgi:hypothetical protein
MTAFALALSGLLLSAQEPNTTTYTKLDKGSCSLVETQEEGGYTLQRCRGVGGFDLLLQSFDSREDIRLAHAHGDDSLHLDQVTTAFNNVGEVVEWRMAGTKVVALILRFLVDESDGPHHPRSHPFLIVAKVRPGGSCVTKVIDARTRGNANVRARRLADHAQASACLWP